jgi:dTDP-4-amino-4,6-dideoxygalactose transaminase
VTSEIIVPFVDLKKQYLMHREAIDKAMQRTCEAGTFILGPEVSRFEQSFADYLGVLETIGVANGTDALRLAAAALGIGPGDEVLIPDNTFIATALAITALGAIPVPVDIDPSTFLINLNDAKNQLTTRTKAIIPVHLYGRCLDMDAVMFFAKEHNLIVIEDACQAHGAIWNGKRAGTFGHAGCFSFYPSKNLGAFGDGGLVATNDTQLANQVRRARNYGSVKKNRHETPGENSRLDGIQAAVLNVKLPFLDEWNRSRLRAACRYSKQLSEISGIRLPVIDLAETDRHVFHLYVIQCEKRDSLLAYLESRGIQAGIHYPVPIHLHPAFASFGWDAESCPVTETVSGTLLSLPIYPEITDDQIDYVAATVEAFYAHQP